MCRTFYFLAPYKNTPTNSLDPVQNPTIISKRLVENDNKKSYELE